MGSTALFKVYGPFFQAGVLVGAPRLYHYLPGTTNLKDAWTDRAKSTTAAQPIVGDAGGIVSAYFDGLYKLVVKDSSDVTLYTWDNVDLTEAAHRLEGSTTWNPGSLLPGQSETSPPFTVTGAAFGDFVAVSAPYDLQDILAEAYVSAADTVKIKLHRDIALLKGSLVFNPASLADGAGETSASVTVTGAVVGDTVLVYPPYDLEDVTVTGYVQAANVVEIRVQNESTGVRDLASGTWHVGVIPRGTGIDLASGSWTVRVYQP